jgi:hypothetical protein
MFLLLFSPGRSHFISAVIVGIVTGFTDRVYHENAAKNVTDLKADSHFNSVNESNQSFGHDFTEMMQILPTHYSGRLREGGPNYCYLRSWVAEVSNNGKEWKVVDRRTIAQTRTAVLRSDVLRCPAFRKPKFDMPGFPRLDLPQQRFLESIIPIHFMSSVSNSWYSHVTWNEQEWYSQGIFV